MLGMRNINWNDYDNVQLKRNAWPSPRPYTVLQIFPPKLSKAICFSSLSGVTKQIPKYIP